MIEINGQTFVKIYVGNGKYELIPLYLYEEFGPGFFNSDMWEKL